MKYAIHAIFIALWNRDFVSAWKLFIDVEKNAHISSEVFKMLKK